MSAFTNAADLIKNYVQNRVAERRTLFTGVVTTVNADFSVNVRLDNGQVVIGLLASRRIAAGEVVSVVVDGPSAALL